MLCPPMPQCLRTANVVAKDAAWYHRKYPNMV
uniref:Uncharacterized protein n=1 Tax=Anguilla anguilla TaxID=7936 RepID=A0A0E9VPZ0_ANGAN